MTEVVTIEAVTFRRNGTQILDGIDWHVHDDERWVVLGPNGAGKTTLLDLIAARNHPTSGHVTVLGSTLGKVDLFDLRARVGYAGTTAARVIPNDEPVRDAVMTAAWGVSGRWRERYESVDEARADAMLELWNLSGIADRYFGLLSDGERKRVQIARALMTDPELLLLDEPAASLDLGAREEFVQVLGEFASSPQAPAIIMVTHHVEEIPAGFTHALVVAGGGVVAAGPIDETVTGEVLSTAYGIPLEVHRDGGRFWAHGA